MLAKTREPDHLLSASHLEMSAPSAIFIMGYALMITRDKSTSAILNASLAGREDAKAKKKDRKGSLLLTPVRKTFPVTRDQGRINRP